MKRKSKFVPSGLVSEYHPGNGLATSLRGRAGDYAIGGNHGVQHGNSALLLDGDNDHVLKADVEEDLSASFTHAIWFKSGDTGQGSAHLTTYQYNNTNIIYNFVSNTIEVLSSVQTGDDLRANSQMTMDDTNWHHICYTYDGSTLKGYIDAVELVSESKSTTFSTLAANNFYAGSSGASDFVDGKIRDVFINSTAISAADVKRLYDGLSVTSDVLFWPMNEKSGSVAIDYTGNGYKGTIVGATWDLGANGGDSRKGYRLALDFEGADDDCAEIASDLVSDFPFTFTCRFRLESQGGTDRTLFWCGDKDDNNTGFWLFVDENGITVALCDDSYWDSTSGVTLEIDVDYQCGVTVWDDSGTIKADVYFNGSFIETLTNVDWSDTFWTDIVADQTSVGCVGLIAPTKSFDGVLSDARLDLTKLSAADHKSLFLGETIAASAEAIWTMEDGDGDDTSGNNNDLTLDGATSIGGDFETHGRQQTIDGYFYDGKEHYTSIPTDFAAGVDDLSLVFWGTLPDFSSTSQTYIASQDVVTTNANGWLITIRETGRLDINLNNTWYNSTSPVWPNDQAEHLLVVTMDRDGNATFYCDGEACATPVDISALSLAPLTNYDLQLAHSRRGPGYGKLTMKSFVMVPRLLTANEISSLYLRGSNA